MPKKPTSLYRKTVAMLQDGVFDVNGRRVDVDQIFEQNDFVGIFRAKQCHILSKYLDAIVETYNSLRAQGKRIELILVSVDATEEDYRKTRASMPWFSAAYNPRLDDTISATYWLFHTPGIVLLRSDGSLFSRLGLNYMIKFGDRYPWDKRILLHRWLAGAGATILLVGGYVYYQSLLEY